MKEVAKILEDIFNSFEIEQTVLGKVEYSNPERTVIEVLSGYHLRKKMRVKVDGIYADVLGVDGGFISVSGSFPNATKLSIPVINYYHGTPYATNILLGEIKDIKEKAPMVYLLETLRDRVIDNPNSAIQREIEVTLFFLDCSLGTWTTDQHYDNVIQRMRDYATAFKEYLFEYRLIESELIEFTDFIPHSNFGTFLTNKGYTKHIFDEIFSGVEMRLTLPFKKNNLCSNEDLYYLWHPEVTREEVVTLNKAIYTDINMLNN